MPNEETTRFLNVDLDIVATIDLGPLLEHLEPRTIALRDSVDNGKRTVWLELIPQPQELGDAVLQFVALVSNLPDELRRCWELCEDRCLNIGIQSGMMPYSSGFALSAEAVASVASMRARVAITVYGAARERTQE